MHCSALAMAFKEGPPYQQCSCLMNAGVLVHALVTSTSARFFSLRQVDWL